MKEVNFILLFQKIAKLKKKIRNIVLIDDSEADNFLNKRVIVKAAIAENITTFIEAKEALDYLGNKIDEGYPKPEIIFLDINMPGMSGWDFLEAYEKFEREKLANIILCMLTTSDSIYDIEKAKEYPIITDYYNKPLTQEVLTEIIEKYFPGYL